MTRGPAWVPITGPIKPGDDLVAGEDRREEVEELVEVGGVAVEHREVLDLPFGGLGREQLQRLGAGAHLPGFLDDARRGAR